jgi:hypothetical protein
MRREPLHIRHRAGLVETLIDAIHQVPARDGETVRRDAPRVIAITQRERLLEHRARRRGAQSVRRLQPMPTLGAASTRAAASHVDAKVMNDDLGGPATRLDTGSDARAQRNGNDARP